MLPIIRRHKYHKYRGAVKQTGGRDNTELEFIISAASVWYAVLRQEGSLRPKDAAREPVTVIHGRAGQLSILTA
jgi:hypothetical protein